MGLAPKIFLIKSVDVLKKEHFPVLSASDRDADWMRYSSLMAGPPQRAEKPGEESGWVKTGSV